MSSSSTEQKVGTTSSSTTPLGWQASHLRNAFDQSKTALGTAQAAPTPDGFVAQFTPEQLSVFQKMMGYGTQGTAGDVGGALSGAGVSATADGLAAAGAFQPKGGTAYNIDAAGQYADNPYMTGMVDAAMRDSRRQVSEQALPQIGRDAALTGNVNSNRRAISEGILERGLAEKGADVSAGLRGGAYDSGLKLAQAEANASNDASLRAMLAQISGGTAAAGAGVDALRTQGDIYDIAGKGVAGQLNAAQAPLDEQMAQYQFGTNSPFDALNNYYNIVGNRNWGGKTEGSSTQTTTGTPSTLDTISKAVGVGGALFGKTGFNWLPSDERVKQDIETIGMTFDGQYIYRYSYINDKERRTHIGLLAQDVEKVCPEAVRTINGVKHVNYDLATREAVVH